MTYIRYISVRIRNKVIRREEKGGDITRSLSNENGEVIFVLRK